MSDVDDSTSFTSSLATSASEPEDLFLGVEAYSFEKSKNYVKKHNVEEKRSNSKSNKNVMILQSDNPRCQVSKLKNVHEILAAREFDACSVLFNLGFGFRNANNNKEKLQILQRFKGSEGIIKKLERNEDCCTNRQNETKYMNKHYIEVKGVNKARDWLNFYHSDQSQSSPLNNEYKTNEINNTSKKSINRIGKIKTRFLKSRQSSFEIMPFLEEEDTTADNSVIANNRKLKRQHNVVVSNDVIDEGSFEEDCITNNIKISKILANSSLQSIHNNQCIEINDNSLESPTFRTSFKKTNENEEIIDNVLNDDDKDLIRRAVDKLQNTSCIHRKEITEYELDRLNSNSNNNNSKKTFKDTFLILHSNKYFKISRNKHVLLHLKSSGQKFN